MNFDKFKVLEEKIDLLLKITATLQVENQDLKEKLKNNEDCLNQYEEQKSIIIDKVNDFLNKLE